MSSFAQLALFLSSYAPLLAVFALLDTFGRGWPTIVCWVFAAIGSVVPWLLLAATRKVHPQAVKVGNARSRTGDVLAYVATYLVPFAAMSASTAREREALGLFVLLVAVLYVRSEMFFVNPLLALFGFRLFDVETPSGTPVVVVCRRRFLPNGTDLKARRLGEYVYWEVDR